MALIFWIIVGLVLVLTGAVVPVAIFIGWLLVAVLSLVFIAMLLKHILPWLILLGLIITLGMILPMVPRLVSSMSTSDIVASAIFALIGILLVITKIKDERELQAIRNRKAGDPLPGSKRSRDSS